ncbi:unnamed protein product [Haemonchus placei]|uniref:CTNNB1_binding domain-containing protein n=1 Tax=Haemonchus placei TaxID=6290 RepID=A0A0N4VXT8_HAEPC|nr:unnamed protein product [Haemonchus placei]
MSNEGTSSDKEVLPDRNGAEETNEDLVVNDSENASETSANGTGLSKSALKKLKNREK